MQEIVFCTTCKNRTAHLAQTLPKNLAGNPRSKFVVLDYGSEDNLLETLKPFQDSGRVSVYSYKAAGPFHMTHAKNMAHRLGILEGADVLVNLDADNYLGGGFDGFVAGAFKCLDRAFLWSGIVKGLGRRFRGTSGRIAVTPKAFIKAGGYDEKFNTWSPDDKDFNERLVRLGYQPIEIDRFYLESIPHGDGIRFKEYPHVRETATNDENAMILPPLKTAVANFGKIGRGEVFRSDGARVELGVVPTRIFGIGLHKTATSSLHAALETLGYESAHWESGAWARDVYDEITIGGVSPTLEKFYALSDLPINVLYKELDRAYPGSKFILTIRDEIDWLRSVRDHFSPLNPHRWEWDVYPFNNKIHRVIYGRTDFEAVTFLQRYRQHNAEVLDYFKNRPDDLLVMHKPDWSNLCKFLDKPIPNTDYPVRFVTQR